jgi:hypothetical protein
MLGWRTVTLIGVIATLLGAFAGLVLSRPVAPKQDDLYTRKCWAFVVASPERRSRLGRPDLSPSMTRIACRGRWLF